MTVKKAGVSHANSEKQAKERPTPQDEEGHEESKSSQIGGRNPIREAPRVLLVVTARIRYTTSSSNRHPAAPIVAIYTH